MRTFLALSLALVSCAGLALAEDPLALKDLRLHYQRETEAVVAPVRERYLDALNANARGIKIFGNGLSSSQVNVESENANGYVAENLDRGETAYGWGNHATAGYLTNQVALGGYETKTVGTEYQASTDGFVLFGGLHNYVSDGFHNVTYSVLTDSNTPAVTVRAICADRSGSEDAQGSIMAPVPKGYFWKATRTEGNIGELWWVPINK